MSPRPRVICFDLDDTLVSEAEYVESGLQAVGALLDRELPGPEPAGEWLVGRWRETRGRSLFQEWLARRGADPDAWTPRLLAAYRDHAPALTLRPGALDALQAILVRGDRLALVSDGWLASQRVKWRALGLALPVSPVVFTDARGRAFWKPHPWGFEQVMAAHPDARGFCYVGDNPAKDFQAPEALGWRTVLLRHEANLHPGHGDRPARAVARSFAEVVALTQSDFDA